jgi:hypothetical protein
VLEASRLSTTSAYSVRNRARVSATALRAGVSLCVITAAFLVAAWFGRTPPFEGRAYDPYAEQSVLRALPFDAPLPYDMALVAAGRGDELAYHVQWTSNLDPSKLRAQFDEHLAGSPKWRLTQDPALSDTFTTTIARIGADGYMTHFAELSIASERNQRIITLDFTPVPLALAPS